MKDICPICEKVTDLSVVSKDELLSIRGEEIAVPVRLFACAECGEEFEDPASEGGPVELAYTEFRKRRGLLQPEEIRNFRISSALTQFELGKLLGFGGATISRYENGALQDEAHDTALRLAMNPHNLIQLIQKAAGSILESKRESILVHLKKAEECLGFQSNIERLSEYEADERSGFKKFDYTKFAHAVLLFCEGGVFTTCLNKLLFYADFLHFKDFAVSLTGLRYAHMPFGPALDKYPSFFSTLYEEQLFSIGEEDFDNYTGERYISLKCPDKNVFADSELRCLLYVKATLGNKTAKELSKISHEETAYKETKNGDLISYTLSEDLSIAME